MGNEEESDRQTARLHAFGDQEGEKERREREKERRGIRA